MTIVRELFKNLSNDKLLTKVLFFVLSWFFFLVCVREAIREHVREAIIDYCNHGRQYLPALSELFRVNSKKYFFSYVMVISVSEIQYTARV